MKLNKPKRLNFILELRIFEKRNASRLSSRDPWITDLLAPLINRGFVRTCKSVLGQVFALVGYISVRYPKKKFANVQTYDVAVRRSVIDMACHYGLAVKAVGLRCTLSLGNDDDKKKKWLKFDFDELKMETPLSPSFPSLDDSIYFLSSHLLSLPPPILFALLSYRPKSDASCTQSKIGNSSHTQVTLAVV
ncbi:10702_t:CDS:2 [Acaulospora morrowiae]|uniref:10702_t:CDS:1 n=1 Tax=Acaulospora morrowiae TaxID=94023 RepID=A0A9N8Z0N5_9GLOM|nr:10702_t:CDS:2 [Acaulospora morrowiae]